MSTLRYTITKKYLKATPVVAVSPKHDIQRQTISYFFQPCLHSLARVIHHTLRYVRCKQGSQVSTGPVHMCLGDAYVSYLEHPLDRLAVVADYRVLRERIRHHLIAADQVLVHNHFFSGGRRSEVREGERNLWADCGRTRGT